MAKELKCFGFTSEDGKTHNSKDLGAEWKLKWTSTESTKLGNYYFNQIELKHMINHWKLLINCRRDRRTTIFFGSIFAGVLVSVIIIAALGDQRKLTLITVAVN
jgi:hypothetical protein